MRDKEKNEMFEEAERLLRMHGLKVARKDNKRPWGGFLGIQEDQANLFSSVFFVNENFSELQITNRLSPKILIVAPGKRLSWQYHFRRAEIWTCIKNQVKVALSDDDEQRGEVLLSEGEIIKLYQGQRHRLIGLDNWGIVAEIWQHTDQNFPSDEDDIVRLQDDFGRK